MIEDAITTTTNLLHFEGGSGMDFGTFFKLVVDGGMAVVVAWIVIRVGGTTLPGLMKSFQEEQRLEREAHDRERKADREMWLMLIERHENGLDRLSGSLDGFIAEWRNRPCYMSEDEIHRRRTETGRKS